MKNASALGRCGISDTGAGCAGAEAGVGSADATGAGAGGEEEGGASAGASAGLAGSHATGAETLDGAGGVFPAPAESSARAAVAESIKVEQSRSDDGTKQGRAGIGAARTRCF
ncbi:hypothetical protein [Myxococcus stipitatus]|uniref:hypothetical protein n=1 Tax=Myxococcus stipitatus TaxID=83455 RepID=UPI0030D4023E